MTELEYIVKQLKERGEIVSERIGTGGAKDYAEYRELVGVIRGLDHANLTLQDFAKRMEQLDNE